MIGGLYYVQYIHTQLVSLLGVCVYQTTLMGGCYYSFVDSYHTKEGSGL